MMIKDESKFGLHGALKAKDGKSDELARILLKAAELVSDVPGNQLYIVSKDSEDKNKIWVTEVWDSKEDHDNSLQDEEVRKLISKAMPLLDGNPDRGFELEVLGGVGL